MMESKSDKKIKVTIIAILAIFVMQIIDVFIIKSNKTVLADTTFARITGIIIILVAAKALNFNIKRRCLDSYGWYFELLYGIGFSVASLAAVYVVELIYFKIKGFYADVRLFFLPPNGTEYPVAVLVSAYAAGLLLTVIFKELFRSFLLNQIYKKTGKKKANFIQAALLTLLFCVPVSGMLLNGEFDGRSPTDIFIAISASVAAVFIGSLKWGYYYRVNGSIWMALADSFVNSFVLNWIYLSPDRLPDKWLLVKCLVVQIVSFVMFIPFYYHRERVNAKYIKEMRTRKAVMAGIIESEKGRKPMPNENVQSVTDLEKDPNELSEKYFTELVETGTLKIKDKITEEKAQEELLSFDHNPQTFSQDFYKEMVDKSVRSGHRKKTETVAGTSGEKAEDKPQENENVVPLSKDPHAYSQDFYKEVLEKASKPRHRHHSSGHSQSSGKTKHQEHHSGERKTARNEAVAFTGDPGSITQDYFKELLSKSRHHSGTKGKAKEVVQSDDVFDFDREPQEFSNAFFKGYVEKIGSNVIPTFGAAIRRKSKTEKATDNTENISTLVDEYFKQQFDKHTYSK